MNQNESRPRIREVGINIGNMSPGVKNHIGDVGNISIGHTTIIKSEGKLIPGKGPIRTGVTVVLPHRGDIFHKKVPAAAYIMNGFGKATGIPQIMELGNIETPIAITNTLNVGIVWDAIIEWILNKNPFIGITEGSVSPIVTECNDGYFNDIRGRHVKASHVLDALEKAEKINDYAEGVVGAGTGMRAFDLKSGVGSSSRIIQTENNRFTVGALSVPNYGNLADLMILGIPVGKELINKNFLEKTKKRTTQGSIISIIATDAPVTFRQLLRIAKRAVIGIARTGSIIGSTSGDFIIAFSTANIIDWNSKNEIESYKVIEKDGDIINQLFRATIEATEESILNALFKACTLTGRDDRILKAIPIDETITILHKHKII